MKHLIRAAFLRWCQITQQRLNPKVLQVPDAGNSKMFIILMGWCSASSYKNLNSTYSPLWAQDYFARRKSGICEVSGKRWCCSISWLMYYHTTSICNVLCSLVECPGQCSPYQNSMATDTVAKLKIKPEVVDQIYRLCNSEKVDQCWT